MKEVRENERRRGLIQLASLRFVARAWLVLFAGVLCTSGWPAMKAQSNAKNVLVLYSHTDHSIFGSVDNLESDLRARVPGPVNFFVESLEGRRLEDKEYEKSTVEMLRHTYGGQKLDLVMAGAYPALGFALAHRSEVFPGVPIVFFMVDARSLVGKPAWTGVTGVTGRTEFAATIDLALRLHPTATTVAAITSDSSLDRYWLNVIHTELLRAHDSVKVVDLIGLSTDRLLQQLARFPASETVVLFGLSPNEKAQPAVGTWDVLGQIGQLLPTYCAVARDCLDRGGIGGFFVDSEEHNQLAAQLAGRILSGERVDDIPFLKGHPARFYADWRRLRRWHIPESALPAESVILYTEPTFWQRDRKYIAPAIVVIAAQALLLIGLLWQRLRRRKAEVELRESEERFRRMADTTPSLVWMCDAQGNVTYLNERRIAFTGRDRNAGYGDTWTRYIHSDDRKKVLKANSEAMRDHRPFSKEYRLRRSDGVYRWMFDIAAPRLNADGSFAGFIGSAIDVTDQKLAQQALEEMSGHLIEAQENERARIARDLHDDICQRLAILSMELEQAQRVSNGQVPASNSLEEIRHHCAEIAGDLQSLSHRLHSSKLDYLGIVVAIRGFCMEFSKQHRVDIEFTDRNVPRRLPKDVSLCLFRIAQEALSNAVKHSGGNRFKVELISSAAEARLTVTDTGAGFDVEESKTSRGIGLVSMRERVHLVHGELNIESGREFGTKILAVVPLVAENESNVDENVAGHSARIAEIV